MQNKNGFLFSLSSESDFSVAKVTNELSQNKIKMRFFLQKYHDYVVFSNILQIKMLKTE